MKPVQTLFIKILSYAYPGEEEKLAAAVKSALHRQADEQWRFRRDLKLALGSSVTFASKKHSDPEIIALVRETSDELVRMQKELGIAAKQLNVAPEDVYKEAKSVLDLENDIAELNDLARAATAKKKLLIKEQKDYQKKRIDKAKEDYEREIKEAEEELKKLDAEHVEAAKEEAVVKRTIANQEEK